jgi:hypothetical protein
MSLALSTELQAAQDGVVHHPVFELTSHNPVASIPFDGYQVSGLSAESEPKLIMHSSGRLVYVYLYNDLPYMGYSDLDRTQWYNGNPLAIDANRLCSSIACHEMADGNIAIIAVHYSTIATEQYVYGMIYTPTGTIVGSKTTAFTWGTNETDYGITLAFDGTSYRWILAACNSVPDPDEYYFRTGTSADFLTWDTATTFVPATLSNLLPYGSPHLFFPINDNPVLIFDYVVSYSPEGLPLTNIYMMESLDDGATWQAPVALTTYTTYGTIGTQPFLSQSTEDEMLFTFSETVPTLYIGANASGWSPVNASFATENEAYFIAFDAENRTVFVGGHSNYASAGTKGVTLVDLDAWEAVDYWDSGSTPALVGSAQLYYNSRDTRAFNGKTAVMHTSNTVAIIDSVNNTIHYWYLLEGSGRNVNYDYTTEVGFNRSFQLNAISMDEDGYVYLKLHSGGISWPYDQIIKIHIDATLNGDMYDSVELYPQTSGNIGGYPRIFKSAGYYLSGSAGGVLHAWVISGDTFGYTSFSFSLAANNIPTSTLQDYWTDGVYIYLATSGYPGLFKYNISDDFGEHLLAPMVQDSTFLTINYDSTLNALMCCSITEGLYVYYLSTDEWVAYNATTIPGITPGGDDRFQNAFYDSVNDGFVVGVKSELLVAYDNYGGILFIPRAGKISRIKYAYGTESSGWTFGTPADLVTDTTASSASTAYVEGSTEFYALWVDDNPMDNTQKLKWDKSEAWFNLTPYLLKDAEIAWTPNSVGRPSTLDFAVGKGELFDIYNLGSMLRLYLQRGRKLKLRVGETIGVTDYLVNQGSYFVESVEGPEYERGNDRPLICRVSAIDRLSRLQEQEITATEYLSNVLASLAFKTYADALGAVDSSLDIGDVSFVGDETLSSQFIDMTLYDILYTLAWRYGCIPRYNMDGYLDVVKMPPTGLTHTYIDNSAIIKISPDSRYATNINSVTVTGQMDDLIQVVHSEEKVQQLNGSAGWWGDSKSYRVYYSEDKEMRCINPRLDVVSTIESIGFELAGGCSEYIDYEDPDGKFVDIKVDVPNLTAALVAAIGTYAGGVAVPDWTVAVIGGITIPMGRIIEGVGAVAAFNILGSIATFQYNLFAQPVGYVARDIQAIAKSDADISSLGGVFPQTIKGYNCNSVADCFAVADRELEIAKAQRRRIKIYKKTHLQDEPGDVLSFVHPFTKQTLSVGVVEISRTYKHGEGIFDEIQGWVKQ